MKLKSIIPSWKSISPLGKNRLVNRSYIFFFLVPILANFLREMPNPVKFVLGGYEFTFLLSLPFSWKLFFFSALFFTIGAALYQLAAPSIVKENDSLGEFIKEGKEFKHLEAYLKNLRITNQWIENIGIDPKHAKLPTGESLVNEIKREKDKNKFKVYNTFYRNLSDYNSSVNSRFSPAIPSMEEVGIALNQDYSKKETELMGWSFWTIYNYANESRLFLRILTSVLYLIGVILILVVIVGNIQSVVNM